MTCSSVSKHSINENNLWKYIFQYNLFFSNEYLFPVINSVTKHPTVLLTDVTAAIPIFSEIYRQCLSGGEELICIQVEVFYIAL